jgi:hypothetical protein
MQLPPVPRLLAGGEPLASGFFDFLSGRLASGELLEHRERVVESEFAPTGQDKLWLGVGLVLHGG